MLLENKQHRSFCYGNALYDLCPVPFYGKYDDYGGVEDCSGFGLPLVVEAIRDQLYKFGHGPNSYHDIEVNKDNFDIKMLFKADNQDRLGVEYTNHYDEDTYKLRELGRVKDEDGGLSNSQLFELDRLANKIKKVDTFRRVTHIAVHKDVFDAIMEKHYIEDYVGDGKGTTGYDNNYNHIYFKDLVASIPEYIRRMKEQSADETAMIRRFGRTTFNYDDECLAGRWLEYFRRGNTSTYGLIDTHEYLNDYIDEGNWDNVALFVKEVLTTAWINSYMSSIHKLWSKQSTGSQDTNPTGYKLLANTVLNILEEERREYGDDEDEAEIE